MIIESELREQIQAALNDDITFSDLYRWVMSRSWNMHKDSTQEAQELTGDVEILFWEQGDGDIDDAELRVQLSKVFAATD